MAQASSVPAREPSMEEILASIRRIIEDSDSGHPPVSTSPQPGMALPVSEDPAHEFTPAAAEAVTPAESAEEVEAFRTELSAMEQEAELQQAPAAARPSQPVPEINYRPAFATAPEPVSELENTSGSVAFNAQPEPFRPEPPKAASVDEQKAAPFDDQPAAAPDTALDHHVPARSSILSEQAGRQVAAAFDELSDAFASTQKRSFDDVAEELMRPMLQDWLDNNLPLLVEKLVREEIERVARGGSR